MEATWEYQAKPYYTRYYYGTPLQRSAKKRSGIMQLLDEVPSDKINISSGELVPATLAARTGQHQSN